MVYMVDTKRFKQAVWEIRKRHQKPRLSKKELREAFDLYTEARSNIARFQDLMRGMIKKEVNNGYR